MRASVLLAGLLVAGCAVGPDYHRPATPSAAAATGGFVTPVGRLATDAPPPGDWWRLYADADLDRLVRQALAANTDLRQAIARLAQARAVLSQTRAQALPQTLVSGGVRYRRGSLVGPGNAQLSGSGFGLGDTGSGSTGGSTSDNGQQQAKVYEAGAFDVAYEVDLFGRIRRSIEAARADVEAEAAATDGVRVTVVAETARAYVGACAAGEQLGIARDGLKIAQAQLGVVQRQFKLGAANGYDVERFATVVEQAAAAIPPIENSRRAALFNLALLTGHAPAEIDPAADRCVMPPRIATPLPVGDGRTLLDRRPDVREAERRLAADTARIGVATADLFPRIALGGSVAAIGPGLHAAATSGLSFAVGPLINWTFPNVAVARARIREARAGADQRLAAFDGAVLTALNETERALSAYATETDRNASLRAAVDRQAAAVRIADASARLGAITPFNLLDTERTLIEAKNQVAASDVELADRTALLFKALGGRLAMTLCRQSPNAKTLALYLRLIVYSTKALLSLR